MTTNYDNLNNFQSPEFYTRKIKMNKITKHILLITNHYGSITTYLQNSYRLKIVTVTKYKVKIENDGLYVVTCRVQCRRSRHH